MMTRAAAATATLTISLLCVRPAAAQVQINPPAIPVVLTWLASDSMDTEGRILVFWFLTEDDPRITPARLDSIVVGLEKIAITGATTAIRQGGVSWLVEANRRRAMNVLQRLVRIFEQSKDGAVQLTLVHGLQRLRDRDAAAAVLGRIAAGDIGRARNVSTLAALKMLAIMDGPGATWLRRLHREQSVEEPRARSFLEGLARRGFPVSDPRRH